jgi:hypothetical protein
MGWLSALGGIAKLASKLFGFMLMRKAVQADVMKDQLDDIHLKNEVTKKINATSVANKRKRLSKYVRRK